MTTATATPAAPIDPGAAPSGPPAIESRGITVYLKPGETRQELEARLERWVATGFNFLVLKVLMGGRILAATETARSLGESGPGVRLHRQETEAIGLLLELAARRDLPVYAGFELLEVRRRVGARNDLLRARPEWFVPTDWQPAAELSRQEMSRRSAGGQVRAIRWLCPVHPDARRLLGDLLVEMVDAFPFDGIYLDHLGLPAAATPSPRRFFPQSALYHAWVASLPEAERANAEEIDPMSWNAWLGEQIIGLLSYLRARVYKVRAHLTMMAEVLSSRPSDEVDPASYDPKCPTGYVEMDWSRAVDDVLDVLSPTYYIGATSKLPELARDLAFLGSEAPLLPVLRLVEEKISPAPFEALRDSSVFGFLVDVGRPLLDAQWGALGELLRQPAMCAHRRPADALQAVRVHTLSLLPPGHELAEFLVQMDHLLRAVEPGDVEKTRKNIVRNLQGLFDSERRSRLNLEPTAEAQVLRNLGLMVRLHTVLASRGDVFRDASY